MTDKEAVRTEAAPAVFCQVFNRCTLADIAQLQRNSNLQVATLAVLRDRMQRDPNAYIRLQSAAAIRALSPGPSGNGP